MGFWGILCILPPVGTPRRGYFGTAPRKNRPPWGYHGGVCRGVGIPRTPQNPINHYFGYQIRILRGRFTPVGSVVKEFFEKFDFFLFLESILA